MTDNNKTIKQIFESLLGEWNVVRKSYSKSNLPHENIDATGIAVFKKSNQDNNTIYYTENITIKISNKTVNYNKNLAATKKYIYKYNNKSNKITKYFENGEFFYTLDFNNNYISGEHLCNQDLYKSVYNIDSNKIKLVYTVKGPKKDYTIETIFDTPRPP